METILEFKGTWRNYQKRVLLHAQEYLKDGKIHIVAAPGSGKTTLGIELIGQLKQPALILAPSITIREQWLERIQEGFLKEGLCAEDYLSNNLKCPKFITVATYQAVHSAMTGFQGKMVEESLESINESDDVSTTRTEEVDYSYFELIKVMKSINLGVLCLDECHHLRSEWWKALENFRKSFEKVKVISLTATPPYDSQPAMWKRYVDMCGEIDEEITTPELVKEGSLCPHQDYVYFNYPTKEEKAEIEKYKKSSEDMLQKLMQDRDLEEIMRSSVSLLSAASEEDLLENPGYLSGRLIYFQAKNIPFPNRLQRLLGAKKLPEMEPKWMEYLLQGLLYDDTDSYFCDKVFKEQMIEDLKAAGLIEKRKVCMAVNTAIEKMIVQSKGKIESIKEIVFYEYANMGKNLRQLILTDYIRKESAKYLGDETAEMNQLGVLPFFEILRREAEKQNKTEPVRLGVLCGSMVVIPAEAKEALIRLVGETAVTFSKAGTLSENDYLVVKAVGNAHFLTAAITELFSTGVIQVLIGTKSLLGEGWDAPCINSLVLASFVGSFMLSNQMRGRAIRIDRNNPEKTSNIWHLVCINPSNSTKDQYGEDYEMLARRMEHFLGLHYTENVIENGMRRLSAIKEPLFSSNVKKTNKEMLSYSSKRAELKQRWEESLAVFEEIEVSEEVDISKKYIIFVIFFDALKYFTFWLSCSLFYAMLYWGFAINAKTLIGIVLQIVLLIITGFFLGKTLLFSTPLRRLKAFGEGIRKAMLAKGMLSSENCKVENDSYLKMFYIICLKGGTGKEKADFAKCVSQVFDEVDNQRYLLINRRRRNKEDGFYVVPDAFSKNKEDAQLFLKCMKPHIGKYELIYTRNEEGRKILLEGRIKALANQENRLCKRKKVKNALE